MPHGSAARDIERYAALAPRIIDLSADFRLDEPDEYARWYGEPHPAPDWLPRFVYGLPELRREALRGAAYASGVGCNATALNLALWPLAQAGLIAQVNAALSVGSSEGGAAVNEGSHHPVRSGAVRTYSAAGHRHLAEVRMMLPDRRPDPLQRDGHRDGARRASAGACGPDRSAGRKRHLEAVPRRL